MADTNRVQLKYIEEATWGTTPGTPTMTEVRMTSESLAFNIANIVSNEIRSDRQTTDLIQTGADVSGGFNGELSYGAYDEFFEGALWDDWSTALSISLATIEATATGFSTTTANGFTTVVAGQWIKVSGFTTAALNTYYKVTTKTGTQLATETAPTTTEAAGDTVTLAGSYIRNGSTEHSYTIQKSHEDLIPVNYFVYDGLIVNSLSFNVEAEAISTVAFEFIGNDVTAATGATAAATTDAASNDVMNAVGNVADIKWDGSVDATLLVRSVAFTISNNLRGLKCIGTLGNADVGAGKVDVTGTINVYFANTTLYNKYVDSDELSLSFRLTDGSGNTYIFTFPRIKIESDSKPTSGGDADVMEDISWRAIRHATYGNTIQIDRFAA